MKFQIQIRTLVLTVNPKNAVSIIIENILSSYHNEGIGVSIGTDDKVLITQNFC